jgi:hypothetical protein
MNQFVLASMGYHRLEKKQRNIVTKSTPLEEKEAQVGRVPKIGRSSSITC